MIGVCMFERLLIEKTDCEFKVVVERAKPKSWLKSVSAFANTVGGTIVFGIDDETRQVRGLANAQDDAEFVSEKIKERIDPIPRVFVDFENSDGKDVLLVKVSADVHPPYYYVADGRREAFVRIGNQSVLAPSEVLNELIITGTNRTWDEIDSRIPACRASFTVLKAVFAQRTRIDMRELDLLSFGLVTEEGMLTNAGALLADEPLLRHSRVFCTRWDGLFKDDIVDTAEYEGGLLILLREARAFVKRHTVESWEKLPVGRIDRRSYSDRAVEEALVNALIHRSYIDRGSEVQVDVYDNRLEIVSPGGKYGAPLPLDVMETFVPSERRNPVIADVFHRLQYMERRGSGLRKICEMTAAEDAYKPEFKPVFEDLGGFFRVTLFDMNYRGGNETA